MSVACPLRLSQINAQAATISDQNSAAVQVRVRQDAMGRAPKTGALRAVRQPAAGWLVVSSKAPPCERALACPPPPPPATCAGALPASSSMHPLPRMQRIGAAAL